MRKQDAGLTSIDYPDGHAEFFNSNKYNPLPYEHAGELQPIRSVEISTGGFLTVRERQFGVRVNVEEPTGLNGSGSR
jgi:hypothetical protein